MQVTPTETTHQTWHITFGTYATRLHNDPRPTVDRRHNKINTPFPPHDPDRQQQPTHPPLLLTRDQCEHIEKTIPQLSERGGWTFITCAAPFEAHKTESRETHQTTATTSISSPPPRDWYTANKSDSGSNAG